MLASYIKFNQTQYSLVVILNWKWFKNVATYVEFCSR